MSTNVYVSGLYVFIWPYIFVFIALQLTCNSEKQGRRSSWTYGVFSFKVQNGLASVQYYSVQFPSHQFVWKILSVHLMVCNLNTFSQFTSKFTKFHSVEYPGGAAFGVLLGIPRRVPVKLTWEVSSKKESLLTATDSGGGYFCPPPRISAISPEVTNG